MQGKIQDARYKMQDTGCRRQHFVGHEMGRQHAR